METPFALGTIVAAPLALPRAALRWPLSCGHAVGPSNNVCCGMGEFAAGIAMDGWVVYGINFDEDAPAIARQQPNTTVRIGAFAD